MAFQNELRRGLTTEEAVLVFLKADKKYDSLSEHWRGVYEDYAMDGKTINNVVQLDGSSYLERLIKMFTDEIQLACLELRAKVNGRPAPEITTSIKLLFENDFDKNIMDIEVTKESIAIWLQGIKPDKSILFDPTESYLIPEESNSIYNEENISDDDNLPSNLYFALCIYKECWKDLPKEMKTPSREDLTKYLNVKGVTNAAKIKAIITISAPDEHAFGGKQSSDLLSWKPLNERMVKTK